MNPNKMTAAYQIIVYVPTSHCEAVKQALFNAGAGHYGLYDRCCWQTLGRGQFRPLAGSSPNLGKPGETEAIDEYRVEMICRKEKLEKAVESLKRAHPYEVPAYHILKLENL